MVPVARLPGSPEYTGPIEKNSWAVAGSWRFHSVPQRPETSIGLQIPEAFLLIQNEAGSVGLLSGECLKPPNGAIDIASAI